MNWQSLKSAFRKLLELNAMLNRSSEAAERHTPEVYNSGSGYAIPRGSAVDRGGYAYGSGPYYTRQSAD